MTQAQIIERTQEVVHGFYGRSIDHLTHYLSDDFVWIGAFDFQFATSKQQFLDIIQSELNATPFIMNDEYYELIARDRDTFILCCKFKLSGTAPTGAMLQMHTRLSVVWKYMDGMLKLVHVHGSNAQDIPLTSEPVNAPAQHDSDDFIEYITTATSSALPGPKRMFRLTSGEHHMISESDILYLQAAGQTTKVFTKDGAILVSGILHAHQDTLSSAFFRIHKSYLINTTFLTSLRRYQATLCGRIDLPIGKNHYLSLKERCTEMDRGII